MRDFINEPKLALPPARNAEPLSRLQHEFEEMRRRLGSLSAAQKNNGEQMEELLGDMLTTLQELRLAETAAEKKPEQELAQQIAALTDRVRRVRTLLASVLNPGLAEVTADMAAPADMLAALERQILLLEETARATAARLAAVPAEAGAAPGNSGMAAELSAHDPLPPPAGAASAPDDVAKPGLLPPAAKAAMPSVPQAAGAVLPGLSALSLEQRLAASGSEIADRYRSWCARKKIRKSGIYRLLDYLESTGVTDLREAPPNDLLLETFEAHLQTRNMTEATVQSYTKSVADFLASVRLKAGAAAPAPAAPSGQDTRQSAAEAAAKLTRPDSGAPPPQDRKTAPVASQPRRDAAPGAAASHAPSLAGGRAVNAAPSGYRPPANRPMQALSATKPAADRPRPGLGTEAGIFAMRIGAARAAPAPVIPPPVAKPLETRPESTPLDAMVKEASPDIQTKFAAWRDSHWPDPDANAALGHFIGHLRMLGIRKLDDIANPDRVCALIPRYFSLTDLRAGRVARFSKIMHSVCEAITGPIPVAEAENKAPDPVEASGDATVATPAPSLTPPPDRESVSAPQAPGPAAKTPEI